MSTLMAEAGVEAKDGNITLKQSVNGVVRKFLNVVESPVMEACYNIIQLPTTQSSIKKEFIMTCRLDECMFIAKDKEILQQLHPNSEDLSHQVTLINMPKDQNH